MNSSQGRSRRNLTQAIRVLGRPVDVASTSDASLVAAVTGENNFNSKTAKSVTVASALNVPLRTKLISALHELARVTPVGGFYFAEQLAKCWPVLKYLGLFEISSNGRGGVELCPSPLAANFHGNVRKNLSEEMGIAFGLTAARRWAQNEFGACTVYFGDIDTLLADGTVKRVPGAGKRHPDYLIQCFDAHRNYIGHALLECKGSKFENTIRSRLATAMSQLSSVDLGNGPLKGLAVATLLTSDELTLQSLDPPDDFELLQFDEFEPGAEPVFGEYYNNVLHLPRRELLSRAVSQSLWSLAEYAGDSVTASQWLPKLEAEETTPPTFEWESDLGSFVGNAVVVQTEEYGGFKPLTIFTGVHESVLAALNTNRLQQVAAAQSELASAKEGRTPELESIKFESQDSSTIASSVLADGSCLVVSDAESPELRFRRQSRPSRAAYAVPERKRRSNQGSPVFLTATQ